jgi:hypothetical protein
MTRVRCGGRREALRRAVRESELDSKGEEAMEERAQRKFVAPREHAWKARSHNVDP